MASWVPLAEGDPLPGDPLGVGQLISRLREEGLAVTDTAIQLRGIGAEAIWQGDAATAFRQRQGRLEPDLHLVGRRIYGTIQALDNFGRAVDAAQSQGRRALADARDAEERIKQAQLGLAATTRQDVAPGEPTTSGLLTRPPAGPIWAPNWQGQLDGAEAQMSAARRLFADACGIYRDAENRCDRMLAEASHDDLADPERRGFLGRVGQAFTNIADHFTDLEKFSDLLGATAAVVGVASVVPGLQFLAPVALVASGLKMVVDIDLAATGRRGWSHVVWDALGLATFGAGRVAAMGARGSVASQAAKNLERVKEVRAAGNVQGLKWTTGEGVKLSGTAAARYVKNTSGEYLREFRADAFEGALPSCRRSLEAMRRLDIKLPAQKILDISPQAVRWATGVHLLQDTGTFVGVLEVAGIMDPNDERPHFVASSHPRAREAEGRLP